MTTNKVKLISFLALSTLFFLLFSRYGMHVTDDGIILAAAKRILVDGQIPHKDFIHLRPVGTFWFWTIPILWGGDYTHLLSRYFVVIQFCLVAFIWLELLIKYFDYILNPRKWIALFVLSCLFSINTFWIFPLYTTDGVFFCSLGFYLAHSKKFLIKHLGYLLMGMGGLAKQNFFGFVPVAIFCLKDLKKFSVYFFCGIPLVSYLTFLYFNDAFEDFFFQMSIYRFTDTFYNIGIRPMVENKSFYRGVLFALIILNFQKIKDRFSLKNYTYLIVPSIFLIYVLQNLFFKGFLPRIPLILLASNLVWAAFLLKKELKITKQLRFLISVLALGWFSSFSLTFHFAHAACYLALPIIWLFDSEFLNKVNLNLQKIFISISITLLFLGFYFDRRFHTFEMSTALDTPNKISEEYPGAKGMIVGDLMYRIMKEQSELVNKYIKDGKKISILPDFTNFWVSFPQANLIPVIWIQQSDIAHDNLISRIQRSIEMFDKNVIVLLENYHGASLHLREDGKQELIRNTDWHPYIQRIVDTAINSLEEIERTEYFIVLRGKKHIPQL